MRRLLIAIALVAGCRGLARELQLISGEATLRVTPPGRSAPRSKVVMRGSLEQALQKRSGAQTYGPLSLDLWWGDLVTRKWSPDVDVRRLRTGGPRSATVVSFRDAGNSPCRRGNRRESAGPRRSPRGS